MDLESQAVDYRDKHSADSSKRALPPEALERLRAHARLLLGDSQLDRGEPDTATAALGPVPETVTVEAPDSAQRRHTARHKTMLSGKLVFNDMSSVLDCFVRDLSETGARIKLAAPVQLPPIFILRFNDGRYHRCRIRRRSGLEIGVEFMN
jgi:hypothetical protein